MTDKYILRGHDVVPEQDLLTWARWLQVHSAECIVARDFVGPYEICTDFLGLDHGLFRWRGGDHPPLVFETMVFSYLRQGKTMATCERYSTWAAALAGHARVVKDYQKLAAG